MAEKMTNLTPFGLRMQPDLKARMQASAEASHRSLNAEIVARLEAPALMSRRDEIALKVLPTIINVCIGDSRNGRTYEAHCVSRAFAMADEIIEQSTIWSAT